MPSLSRSSSSSGSERSGKDGSSVLSRVLGSFRRPPPADDPGKQDTNWIHNYKITHRPDRPPRDMREVMKRRNSSHLFNELHNIWRDNRQKREEKAKAAAESVSSGSSAQWRRRDRRNDGQGSGESRGRTPRDVEPQEARPRSRHSAKGEMVTIRVGMSLNKRELESKRLNAKPRTGTAYSYAVNGPSVSTPPPPSKSQSAPLIPQKAARRRHRNPTSHSPTQRLPTAHPSTKKQHPAPSRSKPNTQRALRESMTSLHINAKRDISPKFAPAAKPRSEQQPSICPLCRNLLRTAVDKQQNLCSDCRMEHQPRQSTFVDAVNVYPSPRKSGSYTSLISEYQGSTAGIEVAEAKIQKLPETVMDLNGSDYSVDKVRVTEILPTSLKKPRGNTSTAPRYRGQGSSRSEFKLQAVPVDRKRARRAQKTELGNLYAGVKQVPGDDNAIGGSHMAYHQSGSQALARDPAPQLPLRRTPGSGAKITSGPILLPTVFCPEAPVAKQLSRSPITRHRLSGAGSRAPGNAATSSGGRTAFSSRARVEKPGAHRTNIPMPRSPGQSRKRHQPAPYYARPGANRPGADAPASSHSNVLRIDKKFSQKAAGGAMTPKVDVDKMYRDTRSEIDSIIDCYRQLPNGTFGRVNEKRGGRTARPEVDFVGSYHMQTNYDLEIRERGFI